MRPHAVKSLARALALLFSLSLLVAIELGSRAYLAHVSGPAAVLQKITRLLRHDADLLWMQRPKLSEDFFGAPVQTDEYGWRNPVGAVALKEEGERRILVLGASPSFGWGVPDAATYSRVLEKRMRELRGERTKVINASIVGFSSWQGRRMLEQRLNLFRPDHVIISYGINDVTRDRFFYSGPTEDKDTHPRAPALANLLAELATPRALLALVSSSSVGTRDFSHSRPVRVSSEDYLANHSEILRRLAIARVSATLLVIPVHFPHEEGSGYAELLDVESRAAAYFARLKLWAQELEVPVVDASEALLSDYERNFLVSQKDYIHPSAQGHAVIARALLPLVLRATEPAR